MNRDDAAIREIKKTAAFVGSRYPEQRILILGESTWDIPDDMTDEDYVRHWIEHPKFSEHWDTCETCYRIGKAKHPGEKNYPTDRLYNALTAMMLDRPMWEVTDEARRDAWSRIAFVNFIGRVLKSRAGRHRPTDKDRQQAAAAFPALLAELNPRPDICLVLDDPSGQMWPLAEPLLRAAGIKAVRLRHPTMILKGGGTPTLEERRAAWVEVTRLLPSALAAR